MSSTRRNFIHASALLAVANALPIKALSQLGAKGPEATFDPERLKNLDGVTADTFEKWTGASFKVTLREVSQGSLVLTTVIDRSTSPASASRYIAENASPSLPKVRSFLLRFVKSGAPLAQDTYTLEHDWLGTFPLLLVPAKSTTAGPGKSVYFASFSLIDSSSAN